ncbi:MAG: hypothetical protein JO247_12250 [Chloroflexi bacterium]|nr:hypothetical protein [Chloroflexota bacterium]
MTEWVSGEELLPFNLHQILGTAICKPDLKAALMRRDTRKALDLHELTPEERRVLLRVRNCADLPHFAYHLELAWQRHKQRYPDDAIVARSPEDATRSA